MTRLEKTNLLKTLELEFKVIEHVLYGDRKGMSQADVWEWIERAEQVDNQIYDLKEELNFF